MWHWEKNIFALEHLDVGDVGMVGSSALHSTQLDTHYVILRVRKPNKGLRNSPH